MSDAILLKDLKFPAVEFTHRELGEFNNVDRTKVWTAYQEAIKLGMIVQTGFRSGKGKPASVWRVAKVGEVVVSLPLPAVPSKPVKLKKEKLAPAPKDVMEETIDTVPTPIIKKVLVETVVVRSPIAPPKTFSPSVLTEETKVTDFGCPICGTKMYSRPSPTGVSLWCPINDLAVCKSSENPYGHANNEKNAYEVACQKFKHI